MDLKVTLQEVLGLVVPVLPGGLVLLLAEGNTSRGSLFNSHFLSAAIPSPTARLWLLLLAAWAIGRALGFFQLLAQRLIANLWVSKLDKALDVSTLWNDAVWRKAATAFLGPMSPADWDQDAWKGWFIQFRGTSYFMRPAQIISHRAASYSICDCALVTLIAAAICARYRHLWVFAVCLPILFMWAYFLYLDYYRAYIPEISRQIQLEYFVRMTRSPATSTSP